MTFLKFDDALELLKNNPDARSFAFYPDHKDGEPVGGTLFVLSVSDEDDEDEGPSYWLSTEGGRFFSDCGEEDMHQVEDLDDPEVLGLYGVDPRTLLYKQCGTDLAVSASGMMTEYAVSIINGKPDSVPDSFLDAEPEWIDLLYQHIPA